jgi:signal transduction histidine kinase
VERSLIRVGDRVLGAARAVCASGRLVTALSLSFLALLAWLDYLTAVEVSLLTFYWIPVGLSTWTCGLRRGLLISGLSVVLATWTDVLGGYVYGSPLVLLWDLAGRALSFSAFTWVLWRLHEAFLEVARHRDHLEELVAERTRDLSIARDRAEAASRAKDAFLANMTHEFRTPLNAVIGFSALLEERARERGDGEVAEQLEHVHSAGTQMLRLVDDVLEIARLDADEVAIELVDPRALVAELVAHARALAAKNGNRVTQSVDPAVGAIHAPSRRLSRVLFHLVENACKFTHHGDVHVAVTGEPGQVCFAVRDDGPGIDSRDLARLFEPFALGDESYARRHGGAGLGLAVARRLCERMGGRLDVESAPGHGSTFFLRLPAA